MPLSADLNKGKRDPNHLRCPVEQAHHSTGLRYSR